MYSSASNLRLSPLIIVIIIIMIIIMQSIQVMQLHYEQYTGTLAPCLVPESSTEQQTIEASRRKAQ